jgi:hypothetical protein
MNVYESKMGFRPLAALVLVPLLAVFLSGCATPIDPGAFQQFTESTLELRETTDEVLGHQYEWARDRFLEATAAGDSISEENIQKLILEPVEGRPFAWQTPEPPLLFLEAGKFRTTVRELNDALVQYAELLVELVLAGRMDEEEFRAVAEGINNGLRDAATTLGGPEANREYAIFSLGATKIFQEYLTSRSKKKLREALIDNQKNIFNLSRHLHEAMCLAARQAFGEYTPRTDDFVWDLEPESGLSPGKKQERLLGLIELDELLILRLATLQQLGESYLALPGANRELADSLDRGESALTSIYRIRDDARRLRELYRDLATPTADQSAGSGSEEAEE